MSRLTDTAAVVTATALSSVSAQACIYERMPENQPMKFAADCGFEDAGSAPMGLYADAPQPVGEALLRQDVFARNYCLRPPSYALTIVVDCTARTSITVIPASKDTSLSRGEALTGDDLAERMTDIIRRRGDADYAREAAAELAVRAGDSLQAVGKRARALGRTIDAGGAWQAQEPDDERVDPFCGCARLSREAAGATE